ncbi:ATP-binding protein [Streptomyces sp. NPDC090025]|uniref:ATP-binding protein n=1 Tax=Streptomyces sp. NPDC090025 TaxID=3365922 RepID=UPI00383880A7
MEPVTAAQLTTALIDGVSRPALWRVLIDGLQRFRGMHAVDDLLRAQLRGGVDAPPLISESLALALLSAAHTAPELGRVLDRWTEAVSEQAVACPGADTESSGYRVQARNGVTGSATVHGAVVQAGDIRGDVHIHVPPSTAPGGAAGPAPFGAPPLSSVAHAHGAPGRFAPDGVPVPRQLLPLPEHFTGRSDALDALEALLPAPGSWSRPLFVVVSGPPGVGKSALVTHWLHGMADSFPDGQLYADLRGHLPDAGAGPAAPSEILGRFLRAVGVTDVPVELAESAALWRSRTAGLRLAVMLDNALSAAQIRPLLPSAPGSLVTITSRSRLTALGIDGASFHQLGLLTTDEAVDLLARRIGTERVQREPDAAHAVATLCEGLPLAVCVAAARLAARPQQSLVALAAALGGAGAARLDALSLGGERAVRTALDDAYRQLPPELALGYRRLGLPPVDVLNGPVAAAACAVAADEGDRLLDALAEVSLLEDLGPDDTTGLGRYRFHDLVRVHAGQVATATEDAAERRATVRRVVDHYLATATAAEELLTPSHRTLRRDYAQETAEPHADGPEPWAAHRPPFDGQAAALGWLDAERFHLMAALRTAAEEGWHATAWQLADAMWPLFLRLRPYDLWVEAHRIGRASALHAGDRQGLSRMLTSGGAGLRNAGRYEESAEWYGQAVEGARADGDRKAEAQALHGLGQAHRLAGRLAPATEYFTAALALREAIGHRRGAALTRVCLGDVALAAEEPRRALAPLAEARAELLAVSDPYDAARALAFLGLALALADTRDAAGQDGETVLGQALDEFAATGSAHWQGRVLEMLGDVAVLRQDPAQARDRYERSLAHYAPVSTRDAARLRDRIAALGPRR